MSDITITPSGVLAGTGAKINEGTAGGTITAGMPVYRDAADADRIKPADANASAASAEAIGIAMHGASAGQPIKYQEKGMITIGATVTPGEIYVVSANAGGIAPEGDLASGWRVSVLGVAVSASQIQLQPINSGVQL